MPGWLLRLRTSPPGAIVSLREQGGSGAPDPSKLADLARSVAREAGDLLLARHGEAAVVQVKSSPTDVVTQLDRAAEELIRNRLLAARPTDAILGEEGGQTGHGAVRWIVDPLDGTVNYLYGLPDWAVSIAAEVDGKVVAAAVCVPLQCSMFTATLGGGAFLDTAWQDGPQRLACNVDVPLGSALVATGFSYSAAQRAVQGQVAAAVLPRVRDIRRTGSAANDLCSVAAGRVDAYFEQGVHEWDIAAGGLIAREAGAMMGGLSGQPPGEAMTIAADPALFRELHDLLAAQDTGRLTD
jgi:fructose-1,6-bisphosphatase/inositol monophosphatase family enzyme